MSKKSMIEEMCEMMSLEELEGLNDRMIDESLRVNWGYSEFPEEEPEYTNTIHLKSGGNLVNIGKYDICKKLEKREDWTTGTLTIAGKPTTVIPFYTIMAITSELVKKEWEEK